MLRWKVLPIACRAQSAPEATSISMQSKSIIVLLFQLLFTKVCSEHLIGCQSTYTDASTQNRRLLHKPYSNRAILSQDYIRYKSFKSFRLWSPNRYEIDLLNEVISIDFGQEDAKIPEVKVLKPLELWWWKVAHLKALSRISLHNT